MGEVFSLDEVRKQGPGRAVEGRFRGLVRVDGLLVLQVGQTCKVLIEDA